jgi:hypothetical protein
MSLLPRVTEKTRELIAREFDARGPDVCMTEIIEHLRLHNPELLDMAAKWAASCGNPAKAMLGFGMFYRLLIPAPPGTGVLIPLPRVSEETRARLVREIDREGPADFTLKTIAELEERNPELLQTADNFASELGNYLQAMQGFALVYRSLVMQSRAEQGRLGATTSARLVRPMTDTETMTAEQAVTLRELAEAAYELDAFKPNITRTEADRRIAALIAKLKLLDGPPHTL